MHDATAATPPSRIEAIALKRPVVRGFVLAAALCYGALAVLHALLLDGLLRWVMLPMALGAAGLALVIWRWGLTDDAPPARLEALTLAMNVAIVCEIVVHALVGQTILQMTYFPIMVLLFAMVGPSKRVFLASLGLTLAAAALCAGLIDDPARSHFLIAAALAALGTPFVFAVHQGALRRQILARRRESQLRRRYQRISARASVLAKQAGAAAEAKSRFIATMSHEIRTPLNGVLGVSRALANLPLDVRQRSMVDLINSSGVTLQRLLEDVLDAAKAEAGRLDLQTAAFDVAAEIEAAVALYRAQALEKGLSLSFAPTEQAQVQCVGDAVRIRQVVSNLVANAVKFTDQGEINVRLDAHETGEGDVWLDIEVEDTGEGIDAIDAEGLFQAFAYGARTSNKEGAGLGLAICKSLVEAMGGSISYRSLPGCGSVFVVRIPAPLVLSARKVQFQGPGQGVSPLRPGEAVRVLVVDDQEVNRLVLEHVLAPLQASLTMANDGLEALALIERVRFDVVLMDERMPRMDGLSAVREIRRREAERSSAPTVIIMLSANASAAQAAAALEAGANAHAAKPVDPEILIPQIVRQLQRQRDRHRNVAEGVVVDMAAWRR